MEEIEVEMSKGENLDKEIDLMEFELTHEQIDDLIEGLQDLKEHKQSFQFSIDEDNDLLIHHEDETEEDGDPDDEEKFVLGDNTGGIHNG